MQTDSPMADKIEKNWQAWKEKLAPGQFHVACEKRTGCAFTVAYRDYYKPIRQELSNTGGRSPCMDKRAASTDNCAL